MKCVWITPFYERSAMNNRYESQALPTRPLHVYSNAVGPGITTAVNHVATVIVLLCRITSALCRLFNRGYCQRIPTLQQSALPHVVRRFFPQWHRIVGIAAVAVDGQHVHPRHRRLLNALCQLPLSTTAPNRFEWLRIARYFSSGWMSVRYKTPCIFQFLRMTTLWKESDENRRAFSKLLRINILQAPCIP